MSPKTQQSFIDVQQLLIVLKKSIAVNSKPTEDTFPELPTVLIWIRFVLAVTYGTLLGIRNVRGAIMILNAINILTFLPIMYCRFYLRTDADQFRSSLLFSGVVPSIALTLLIWIYFYTQHHEAEAAKLSSMLLLSAIASLDGDSIQSEDVTTISGVEDAEF
jgi:hypothetical protein